ncbi:MAG TPA: hypothetical protein VGE37_02550 [Archangium sp.]
MEELEHALAAAERKALELQAWADASDQEAEQLRAQLASRPASEGGGGAELVERISSLEAVNHSLRRINEELGEQLARSVDRDKERLASQLEAARTSGADARAEQLERALLEANEAVATLESQKAAAVEQVKRIVAADHQAEDQKLRELERQLATLEMQLAEKTDEASVLQVRLKAHEGEERKLMAEVASQRERACVAEEKLGRLEAEVEGLRNDKASAEARASGFEQKLDETKRWLAAGELEVAELERKLDAAKTANAMAQSVGEAAPAPAPAPVLSLSAPPPPRVEAANDSDLEGFSPEHMHRLEALLAAEKLKSELLARFAATSEVSLKALHTALDDARAKVMALSHRLNLAEGETDETLERLAAAQREVHALFKELAKAQPGEAEELEADDVLDAPLDELETLSTQQASAAKEAADVLVADQRAREQLVGDLQWLKAELEKLSHVREDLKLRLQAMVKRELARKQTVSALLQKLRSTEVAAAARAGTMRRLQAAMHQAQVAAVRVQTIYFQKQIGSLQRQLERRAK